jgi:hypothetical protein
MEVEKTSLHAEGTEPDAPFQDFLLHPKLGELYRVKVEQLECALESGSDQAKVRELMRSMIDRVVLTSQASRV